MVKSYLIDGKSISSNSQYRGTALRAISHFGESWLSYRTWSLILRDCWPGQNRTPSNNNPLWIGVWLDSVVTGLSGMVCPKVSRSIKRGRLTEWVTGSLARKCMLTQCRYYVYIWVVIIIRYDYGVAYKRAARSLHRWKGAWGHQN